MLGRCSNPDKQCPKITQAVQCLDLVSRCLQICQASTGSPGACLLNAFLIDAATYEAVKAGVCTAPCAAGPADVPVEDKSLPAWALAAIIVPAAVVCLLLVYFLFRMRRCGSSSSGIITQRHVFTECMY